MPGELIERMARAMAGAAGCDWDVDTPDDHDQMRILARAALQTVREPTKAMIDKGIEAARDCVDSDWDSGPTGEDHNSYERLRSDAPQQIFTAMIDAELGQ